MKRRAIRVIGCLTVIIVAALPIALIATKVRERKIDRSLLAAAKAGNLDAFAAALGAGADPDIADGAGKATIFSTIFARIFSLKDAMHHADSGQKSAATILLSRKVSSRLPIADLNVYDGKLAVIVDDIVRRRGHVDCADAHGLTPLIQACRYKLVRTANSLIRAHANVNQVDDRGETPLYYADSCTSRKLFAYGARAEVLARWPMPFQDFPLHQASLVGDADKALLLLGRGANPNKPGKFGQTAFELAASSMPLWVVQRFLACGATISIPDTHAVAFAGENDDVRVLQLLLNCDKSQNRRKDEVLALFRAVQCSNIRSTRYLLDLGVPVNEREVEVLVNPNVDTGYPVYNTALHYSSGHGDMNLMRLLLARHCSVNVRNDWGETPLLLAANSDHLDAVRLLLSHGASWEIADHNGKTPEEYLRQHGLASNLK